METAIQVILFILAYVFLGGIFARLLWPVQKLLDRKAIKRDPTILKSVWDEHLEMMCIFWPLLIVAYLCVGLAILVKAIFSIGISSEDRHEV